MRNLAIATTILFAAFAATKTPNLLACSFVTIASYLLWGSEIYFNKKFKKKDLDTELAELELQFRKSELSAKINDIERHNARQAEKHATQQEMEKSFKKGISW